MLVRDVLHLLDTIDPSKDTPHLPSRRQIRRSREDVAKERRRYGKSHREGPLKIEEGVARVFGSAS
jgi:hypothetical protein